MQNFKFTAKLLINKPIRYFKNYFFKTCETFRLNYYLNFILVNFQKA